jgi:hypothetical protein
MNYFHNVFNSFNCLIKLFLVVANKSDFWSSVQIHVIPIAEQQCQ